MSAQIMIYCGVVQNTLNCCYFNFIISKALLKHGKEKKFLKMSHCSQCPAGRVFQYRVRSGRVLDKISGSGSVSGRVDNHLVNLVFQQLGFCKASPVYSVLCECVLPENGNDG